jgi:hypothetical protein
METVNPVARTIPKEEAGITTNVSYRRAWAMLFSRIALFLTIQSLFALGYYLAGSSSAWEDGAAWWPIGVTITNLIVLVLMVRFFESEGKRFWDIFRIQRKHVKSDLLVLAGILVITGPASILPNILIGSWLFEDPAVTLELMVRPLPVWVALASVILFPVTQGLAELPNYFGYIMPRFEGKGMRPWLAVTLPALLLGLQHLAVPFLFNISFITWRGLMFIPFAFLVGIMVHWRPRLMPYLVIVHVLMDMYFATMLLGVAY